MEPAPRPIATPGLRARRGVGLRGVVAWSAGAILVILLPFLAFVRTGVWLFADLGAPTWVSVGGAMAVTAAVVTAYVVVASVVLTGRPHVRVMWKSVALPLVLLYGGYTLIYLSSANAKTESVRSYYGSLHPILRMAVATWILVDRELVVTDLQRTPEAYRAMGLTPRDASDHYVQPNGYVHAMDLRTRGRGAWRNAVVRVYFGVMGFRTLRHVGTADHLHVALPVP